MKNETTEKGDALDEAKLLSKQATELFSVDTTFQVSQPLVKFNHRTFVDLMAHPEKNFPFKFWNYPQHSYTEFD